MLSKIAVLIPAAGSSVRFGGKQKKQFTDLNGREVFLRTIERFADRNDVTQIIIAIPAEDEELFEIKHSAKLSFFGVKYIVGDEERYKTILKMIEQVNDDIDLIAIHDAVRPCVSEKQINEVFTAASQTGAAILASPLVGTIKKVNEDNTITETVDRSLLWEAATPQVFKPDIIKKAYENLDTVQMGITDDSQLVEATGVSVQIVKCDRSNIKITNLDDLTIAAAILKNQENEKAKTKKDGPSGPWASESAW